MNVSWQARDCTLGPEFALGSSYGYFSIRHRILPQYITVLFGAHRGQCVTGYRLLLCWTTDSAIQNNYRLVTVNE